MLVHLPAFVCVGSYEFEAVLEELTTSSLRLSAPVALPVGARVTVTFFSVELEGEVSGTDSDDPCIAEIEFSASDEVRSRIEERIEQAQMDGVPDWNGDSTTPVGLCVGDPLAAHDRPPKSTDWRADDHPESTEPSQGALPLPPQGDSEDLIGLETTMRGDEVELQVRALDPGRDVEVEETLTIGVPDRVASNAHDIAYAESRVGELEDVLSALVSEREDTDSSWDDIEPPVTLRSQVPRYQRPR